MFCRFAFAAAFALASAPLHATTYAFEVHHTQGVIRWSHLGFSNPTAQFTQVEGTLEFDPADPTKSSVTVAIPLTSMSSGLPDLDDDFRSANFFDVPKFPTATFKSTKVEKGGASGQLKVTGDFSVHGVTKPVVLDVTLNKIGVNPRNNVPSIGFEATTTLRRSEFGLGNYVPQVSDEIQVHVTCQADEAKAYVQHLKANAAAAAVDAKRAADEAAVVEAAAMKAPAVKEAAKN
ncbi:YceI family protein [Dokdonella soli]|uniref:Lipid/polyisoprenoid-binding YceI-like domain-containing protein n=1 Tax=Dokdonella soli TaxID=529810 RepID=A0ABN1IMY3_9GAMM